MDLIKKPNFSEGCSWLKFSNLGLGVVLKFYTSVAEGLKLKVRKFWDLIPTFVEFAGENLVGGLFAPLPILKIFKRELQSLIYQFNLCLVNRRLFINTTLPKLIRNFYEMSLRLGQKKLTEMSHHFGC